MTDGGRWSSEGDGKMPRSDLVILLAVTLAAAGTVDLAVTLIAREKRPQNFWQHVYGRCVVVLLCVAVILWARISAGSF
jgi:hypothetical protein